MINKEDIIKIVKELNLPKNEYWITSGAGLVMHNVKKGTNDVDLGCTKDLFEQLIKKGYNYKIIEDNLRIMTISDVVEVIENWFVDEIIILDGMPVATLESIRKQKLQLGREKDFRDIELIDEFVKSQNRG